MSKEKTRVDRRKVKAWMVMNNIRVVDIKRSLGYKSTSPVVETVNGTATYLKVLTWLKDNGCPVADMNVPKRMRDKV